MDMTALKFEGKENGLTKIKINDPDEQMWTEGFEDRNAVIKQVIFQVINFDKSITVSFAAHDIDEDMRIWASERCHKIKETLSALTTKTIELEDVVIQDMNQYFMRSALGIDSGDTHIIMSEYERAKKLMFKKDAGDKSGQVTVFGKEGILLAELLRDRGIATFETNGIETDIKFNIRSFQDNPNSIAAFKKTLHSLGFKTNITLRNREYIKNVDWSKLFKEGLAEVKKKK